MVKQEMSQKPERPYCVILPTGDFCVTNSYLTLPDGSKLEMMNNSFGLSNAQLQKMTGEEWQEEENVATSDLLANLLGMSEAELISETGIDTPQEPEPGTD